MTAHIVNVSGGKDSTATYLLALEAGMPFRAVFADTGHEHPITYAYVMDLPRRTGGPPVDVVRADFTADIDRKRAYIAAKWPEKGVPAARVARALDLLHSTGVPYLDLCMWKGRFPSRKAQFCTEELKKLPIRQQVLWPALKAAGRVVQWMGVRADESLNRAGLPMLGPDDDSPPGVVMFRPILNWSAADVFDRHARHGVKPNPLYRQGMTRVGCMPCINACKGEIAEIARRWPAAFDKLRQWEGFVADCSKRGMSTFFHWDVGRGTRTLDDVLAWSRTSHGGRQFDLEALAPVPACSSTYGLCE